MGLNAVSVAGPDWRTSCGFAKKKVAPVTATSVPVELSKFRWMWTLCPTSSPVRRAFPAISFTEEIVTFHPQAPAQLDITPAEANVLT